jgi:predicted RNA-binding Zn-ribbon protein involved in translation (DUF1610 family)
MTEDHFECGECDYHIITCERVIPGDSLHLDFSCDMCGHDWSVTVDIEECRSYSTD